MALVRRARRVRCPERTRAPPRPIAARATPPAAPMPASPQSNPRLGAVTRTIVGDLPAVTLAAAAGLTACADPAARRPSVGQLLIAPTASQKARGSDGVRGKNRRVLRRRVGRSAPDAACPPLGARHEPGRCVEERLIAGWWRRYSPRPVWALSADPLPRAQARGLSLGRALRLL
jgi:hypothetical protein